MIKTRQNPVPPLYQLEVAHALVKADPDAALRILKADPLEPVGMAALTIDRNMEALYTDGLFGDPYKPVAIVPRDEKRRIKIVYRQALEEYQTELDKLWSSDDFGIRYTSVIDWFNDDDAQMFDLSQHDRRYHQFDYVGHFDVIQREMSDSVMHTVLVWEDIESGKSYSCETVHMKVNT